MRVLCEEGLPLDANSVICRCRISVITVTAGRAEWGGGMTSRDCRIRLYRAGAQGNFQYCQVSKDYSCYRPPQQGKRNMSLKVWTVDLSEISMLSHWVYLLNWVWTLKERQDSQKVFELDFSTSNWRMISPGQTEDTIVVFNCEFNVKKCIECIPLPLIKFEWYLNKVSLVRLKLYTVFDVSNLCCHDWSSRSAAIKTH